MGPRASNIHSGPHHVDAKTYNFKPLICDNDVVKEQYALTRMNDQLGLSVVRVYQPWLWEHQTNGTFDEEASTMLLELVERGMNSTEVICHPINVYSDPTNEYGKRRRL